MESTPVDKKVSLQNLGKFSIKIKKIQILYHLNGHDRMGNTIVRFRPPVLRLKGQ